MKKTQIGGQLLSISQVAELFSIDKDTLRNWEKKGLISPLRVGPRKDRKYRPADLEKMMEDMNLVKGLGG
jgi:DNA-binding transcriptional MerR regulator